MPVQDEHWELLGGSDALDDLDQLIDAVAVVAGVVNEFACSLDDCAAFGCREDGDAASASELEQSFVAKEPEGAQHGVGVDAEYGGEVLSRRQSFAGFGFAVGDGTADLGCDLFVEIGGVGLVDLDRDHRASDTSTIVGEVLMSVAAPPRGNEASASVEHDAIEALIEEARERARRRRRVYGAAASVVAVAAMAAIVGFNGAGSSGGQRSAQAPAAEAAVGDLGVFEPIRGWIVFPDGAGIYAVDPDNPLRRHTVLEDPQGIGSQLSPVGWSADGTELALIDEGESGGWIMDSTGSLNNVAGPDGCCSFVRDWPIAPDKPISPDNLTANVDLVTLHSKPASIQLGNWALSPDREQVLITAPGDQGFPWLPSNPPATRGLYVGTVDFAGTHAWLDRSTVRRIAAESYLAAEWSPDGTRIAAISAAPDDREFVAEPEGRELVVMNADGTGKRALIELDSDRFTGIAWHPLAP